MHETRAPTFDAEMMLATGPADVSRPTQGHGAFDTYRFVTELENAGVPKDQAVAMMEQVLLAISEANTRQIALVSVCLQSSMRRFSRFVMDSRA